VRISSDGKRGKMFEAVCLLQEKREQMPKKGAVRIITDNPFLFVSTPTCGQQCHQNHDKGMVRQRHRQRLCYFFIGTYNNLLGNQRTQRIGPMTAAFDAIHQT